MLFFYFAKRGDVVIHRHLPYDLMGKTDDFVDYKARGLPKHFGCQLASFRAHSVPLGGTMLEKTTRLIMWAGPSWLRILNA